MRRVAITIVGVLAIAVVASCLVNRKSSSFECSIDDDCDPDRRCEQGYCIESGCPEICTSCDPVAKSCAIECNSAGECDNVSCPTGFDCAINCSAGNACDNVACGSSANSCTITCSAPNACEDVSCGSGTPCTITCSANGACADISCGTNSSCKITCSALNACGSIGCSGSCKCDVTCPTGNCDTMSCPSPGTTECTIGGVVGAECDSDGNPGACSTCSG